MSKSQKNNFVTDLIQNTDLIVRWDLEEGTVLSSNDELKQALQKRIAYLLDYDLNQLLNIFYRLDIPEDRVKTTLASEQPDQIATTLADLVIERELQKQEFRRKYCD